MNLFPEEKILLNQLHLSEARIFRDLISIDPLLFSGRWIKIIVYEQNAKKLKIGTRKNL